MSRKIVFTKNEYYHVFNRGTDKRKIFTNQRDLQYFFNSMSVCNQLSVISNRNSDTRDKNKMLAQNSANLVDIVAYCLLPNHFHLILKEVKDGGISKFMQRLGVSYTKYFNLKYDRNGVLFQGKFKATHLHENYPLDYISAYVNLNYKHHKIDPKTQLVKTSLFEFLGTQEADYICSKPEIENIIKSLGGLVSYKRFLKEQSQFFIKEKGHSTAYEQFKELD